MWTLSVEDVGLRAETLSVDVLGVDRLSVELLGRLLVEELVELNVVKLMSTLCGLGFSLFNVMLERWRGLGGLSGSFFVLGTSSCVKDSRLAVNFEFSVFCAVFSASFEVFRLGEGDLELFIHDFLANVANDSDTVFVLLSLAALGIGGTGGTSSCIVVPGSLGRSGEPFTRCIHDFGRATNDFLLPTLSGLGRSSLDKRLVLVFFPSLSFCVSDSPAAISADTNLRRLFSSRADRQLKLAARGS